MRTTVAFTPAEDIVARRLSLAEKLDLLFQYGESRGISSAYRTIAEATDENANNIRKIHRGENTNPGLKILTALVQYFGVGLDYFMLTAKADCEAYLARIAEVRKLEGVKLRANGLSEAGMDALNNMLDFVRKAEGLPPVEPPDE
jgi:transcriptional regulator with XRE-family HTH domain